MAARYSSGQYEDSFNVNRLQNWTVPHPSQKRPSLRKGSTSVIANDQGHLLPSVPRSQVSPWGTFVGTWDMPRRIPPARLSLTSRSATAAAKLLDQIRQPTTLMHACNGLQTELTGKPQELQLDTQTLKEPSQGSSQASSKYKASPQIPASIHSTPREASSEQATSQHSSAPSRSGSRRGRFPQLGASRRVGQGKTKPQESRFSQLGASPRAGAGEAEPQEGTFPQLGA